MTSKTILAAALLWAAHAQAEETCGLKQYASLDMTTLGNGEIAVQAMVDDNPVSMAASVSFPYSYLFDSYPASGAYPRHRIGNLSIEVAGDAVSESVTVPSLALGNGRMQNLEMLWSNGDSIARKPAVGGLGVDVLSRFDVELDFQKRKINLFSQDHCPGKVVYWSNSYAAVPLDIDMGHPSVQMELDGKPVSVEFDLVPGSGVMGLKTALRIFGIDRKTPGVDRSTDPVSGLRGYRFAFKQLSVPGIALSNPSIVLDPHRADCLGHTVLTIWHTVDRCFGASDVLLGMEEIKQLHLYIAYREKKLYITPADAHL